MKKSIRLKLLSMFLFSLAVALFVSFVVQSVFLRPYYLNHTEERLLFLVSIVDEYYGTEQLEEMLVHYELSKQVEIIVTDRNMHNVEISFNQMHQGNVERLDRELHSLVADSLEILEESHLFSAMKNDVPRLVLVKKLSSGQYCIMTQPMESMESNLAAMNEFYFLTGSLACLMGVLATFYFSKHFTHPIIEISRATEAMANLDFSKKISYTSADELGQLAHSINRLSEKLEENGIALQNEIAFQKVLSQNMSHELKTPISVIKGYVEALSFGVAEDKETQDDYISVVLKECDRMNELIGQMLHLSKLNSYQDTLLEKEFIPAVDFATQIKEQCTPLIQQKNIPLQLEIRCDSPIYAHRELLVQAFSNFLSNAIKYGDGKELKLTMEENESHHTLSLYNSGAVISQEEAEKVFDVFYMVDKVRSRENNSHGLGLSVTKTISNLHHGSVSCTPEEKGMLFSIVLPKYTENTPDFHKKRL